MSAKSNGLGKFDLDGFTIVSGLVGGVECSSLAKELSALMERAQDESNLTIGGVRNLLRQSSSVAQVAEAPGLMRVLQELTGAKPFPVRAICFDKTPDANWLVPWHQDLTIAVAGRIEASGFEGWSTKNGVAHVQAPTSILESMVTVRLHLDECNEANGALKVVPGSHRLGRLDSDKITELTARQVQVCEGRPGDVMIMRPLLLHASASAKNPTHRRVLHIEYAIEDLPDGLEWFEKT